MVFFEEGIKMEALDFHWRIVDVLFRLKGQTETFVQPYCSACSLTPQLLRIMMTLHFEGEMSVSGLARRTCMADANNSAACKKLAGMGYVRRRRHPEDERLVLISLTDEGRGVVAGLQTACDAYYDQIAGLFEENDAEIITAGLNRLVEIMEMHKETIHEK